MEFHKDQFLGLYFFLIYVNHPNLSIHGGKLIHFADDTTFCFKAPNKSYLEITTFLNLNTGIQKIKEINLLANKSK